MASEALDRAEATAAYSWTARVVDFGGSTATRAAALQDIQTWLAGCL